ncbi:putative nickel-responsive regulator [Methanocella paludicola SANAE]|uniref:Putative nickel-responsive regulator n=1 Tax=Methanocella paludicola (strain DSM 17711 / JCM 13418 / NBRC 101707 / SANAE) TaxID=304371 RepID=D1YXH4_METPS|nr:nickel-responsive transcriptional regulator NikR [Methanocella paludicola]BAI61146.1 putative nickel-responsive regulator [Methanocella paludicola SANAE]
MQDLARIGISVPGRLMGRFDEVIAQRGYSSRSEGIRDAIRDYIQYEKWMSKVRGDRIGIISILYNQDKRKLVSSLMQVRHDNSGLILTTIHKYLDKDNCMDVIIVRGEGGSIRAFTEKLMANKCVKHVKLTTILPEAEI